MNKDWDKLIEKTEAYLHTMLGIRCVMVGGGGLMVRLPYYLRAGNGFAECNIKENNVYS